MQTVFTRTATNTAISVAITHLATPKLITLIIPCKMYDYKDQLDGCTPEESLRKSVSSTKPTKKENFYAIITSMALERLSEQK